MQSYGPVIFFYLIILLVVCVQIIFATRSSTKALAYLLFCVFAPVVGMIFYITFGINYWRKKRYSRKSGMNAKWLEELNSKVSHYAAARLQRTDPSLGDSAELVNMLIKDLASPLTTGNNVKLLVNGDEKFEELLKCMDEATHHIHIEYYIYEQDEIGTKVIEMMIKKAKQGVQVRFIYDDFGSPGIKKKLEKRMRDAGVQVHPFHKVHFYLLANRINYRNHRKIVIIDGQTGFTGGINVSDKYVNNIPNKKLFWRDTHLRIDGPGVYYMQYLFLTDWNFCCADKVEPDPHFFKKELPKGNKLVQIVASGPDSPQPSVMFSILEAIYLAKKEILITTPYFIPGESIMDALVIAASSGIDVKLLVPGVCDSKFVNAASKDHYSSLLKAGVEIYIYQKGFVHAKTLITDQQVSMVGTANMDHRSFELNFEVNAIVYDKAFAMQLREVFFSDLKDAEKLMKEKWLKRSIGTRFIERTARLFSPSL